MLQQLLTWLHLPQSKLIISAAKIMLILIIAFPLIHTLSAFAGRAIKKQFSEHSARLAGKIVSYAGFIFVIIMVLNQLGINLGAVLGAAGIAGIAIGFAAQTSISNIICGLFLLSEKPMQVGDLIKVGDTTGLVHSIDLLSVKLRKLDNLYVRVPNEILIKNEFTNITRFPIRRMDLDIGVAYKEDVARVMEVLGDIARQNPFCLDEPKPIIIFKNFGDSALEFMLGLWFVKTDYIQLRNSIMREIKERFDFEKIEIPFPHRTIYTGLESEPFPVRIVSKENAV